MKLRVIFASFAAVLAAAVISAQSANLSLFSSTSGCQESSQQLSCLNQLIQAVNGGVSGVVNTSQTSASTTATTAEVTLQTFTLPANFLSGNSQSLDIECWGQAGATASQKTLKIYFGATSVSSGVTAANGSVWRASMKVDRTGAATQNIGTIMNLGTTSSSNYSYGATNDFTTALTIKCTGQNYSASDPGNASVGGMRVIVNR